MTQAVATRDGLRARLRASVAMERARANPHCASVAALAHLAHHFSRAAITETRLGHSDEARTARDNADWYLAWARRRRVLAASVDERHGRSP